MSLTIQNNAAVEAVNAIAPVQSLAKRMEHEHSKAGLPLRSDAKPKPAPISASSSSAAHSDGVGQGVTTSSAPSSAAASESASAPEHVQEPSAPLPDPIELPDVSMDEPRETIRDDDSCDVQREDADAFIERVVPRVVPADMPWVLPALSPASGLPFIAPHPSADGMPHARPQPGQAAHAATLPWMPKGSAVFVPPQAAAPVPTAAAAPLAAAPATTQPATTEPGAPQQPAAASNGGTASTASTASTATTATFTATALVANAGAAALAGQGGPRADAPETKAPAQGSGQDTGSAPPALTPATQEAVTRQAGDTVASEAGQARSEANAATQRSVQHVQQAQKTQEALAQRARAESRVEVSFNSWGAGHSVVGRQQNGQWVMTPSTARVGMALSNSAVPDGLQVRVAGAGDRVDACGATDADGRRRQQHEHDTP